LWEKIPCPHLWKKAASGTKSGPAWSKQIVYSGGVEEKGGMPRTDAGVEGGFGRRAKRR